jgi:nicotinamide riboside transporter PnuC
LQGREPKGAFGAIMFQNKFYGAMAQAAVAVIENIFGLWRDWEHRKA